MSDRDEILARLTDEVRRMLEDGEQPDPASLAEELGVDPVDAEDCIRGLAAFEPELRPLPELPPLTLPEDYEILEEIGRGGMGVVYRARQRSLDRQVAVKVLRPGDLVFGDAIRRFSREAKSLARLRHPHIVSIHEVGHAGGHVFFSMDLIEGQSLADRLAEGPLTATEAVRILTQVADAIAYTHGRGIVHRDLKPGNVLIDAEGSAFVVDFGLARDLLPAGDGSGSAGIIGTPDYMSPEQAAGDRERIGEASDVYALGAILYECLTGRTPFAGRSLAERIHAVIHEDPTRPRRVDPRVPKDLEAVCLTAMEKRPERRYPTARALFEDLSSFEQGGPVRARRPGAADRAWRYAGRHRKSLVAAIVGAAAISLLFALLVLPKLGRTPVSLLRMGEDLLAEGEHGAAAVLFEQGLRRHGARGTLLFREDGEPWDPLACSLHRGLARARMESARSLFLRADFGRAEELQALALEEADRAFGDRGWPEKRELIWDMAECRLRAGDRKGAADIWSVLRRHQEVQSRDRVQPAASVRGVLDRIRPALEAPRDPAHPVALLLLLGALGDTWGSWHALDWLSERGDGAVPMLIGLLTPYTEETEGRVGAAPWQLQDAFARVRAACSPGRLEGALVRAMQDPHLTGRARAVAAGLLCRLASLPCDLPWARENDFPEPVSGLWTSTLSLWTEVRGLPRLEGYRRRVEWALERVATDLRMVRRLDRWLRQHTGYRPESDLLGLSEAWRDWWEVCRAEDPRRWLARAVGREDVPGAADLRDLLDGLSRAGRRDRVPYHRLLELNVPEGIVPPSWPGDRNEPPGLVDSWASALEPSLFGGPHLLRVAAFELKDGEPEPRLRWEELRPIRLGEQVEITRTEREAPIWTWGVQVPGLGVHVPDREGRERSTGIRAVFRYRRGGPVIDFVQVDSGSGNDSLAGMVLSADHIFEKSPDRAGRTRVPFLLGIAEEPGCDPRPWTIEDWRGKLVENLEFLARGLEGNQRGPVPGRTDFFLAYQQSVYLQPRLAAFLGLPGGAEALARLVRAAKNDHAPTEYEALPALLLAGDATRLSEPGFETRLARAARAAMELGHEYWTRLLLQTRDRRIRELAARQLRDGEIPAGPAATLERALREGRADAPGWLREKVDGAEGRLVWAEIGGGRVWLIGGGLSTLGLLLAAGLLLHPMGSPRRRLPAAAWMVLFGMVLVSVHVDHRGRDLLPDAAGYAAAAIGVAYLLRTAGGRAGRVALAGFAAAFVLDLVGRLELLPTGFLGFSGLGAAAGVLALPHLAVRLDPHERSRRTFPVFHLCYGLPALLLWGTVLLVLVGAVEELKIEGNGLMFVLIAVAGAALWALLVLLFAAHRRGRQRFRNGVD